MTLPRCVSSLRPTNPLEGKERSQQAEVDRPCREQRQPHTECLYLSVCVLFHINSPQTTLESTSLQNDSTLWELKISNKGIQNLRSKAFTSMLEMKKFSSFEMGGLEYPDFYEILFLTIYF